MRATEGRSVLTTANACSEHDRGKRADDGENEQIRPLQPSLHDSKIFGQGIGEHGNQEDEQPKRKMGDEAERFRTDLPFTIPDEPPGADKCRADTQTEASENRKVVEPAQFAAATAT